MRGERLEIGDIAGENRAPWLGDSHHNRIDSRAAASSLTKLSGTTRQRLGDERLDHAGFEELVRACVVSGMGSEGLDEDHRRDDRRPQRRGAK